MTSIASHLLKVRGRQPLLTSEEVLAQVARHKAARNAEKSGSGNSASSPNGPKTAANS
jgi:hypothetical protein